MERASSVSLTCAFVVKAFAQKIVHRSLIRFADTLCHAANLCGDTPIAIAVATNRARASAEFDRAGGEPEPLGLGKSQGLYMPGDSAWMVGTPCTTGSGAGPVPLPIGRFGDAQVGSIEGPSYWNLNSGLVKTFSLTSKVKLSAEGTFTNVLNHVNLNQPNLNLSTVSFGSITSGLAPRVGQVSMRVEFFSLSKGLVRLVESAKNGFASQLNPAQFVFGYVALLAIGSAAAMVSLRHGFVKKSFEGG